MPRNCFPLPCDWLPLVSHLPATYVNPSRLIRYIMHREIAVRIDQILNSDSSLLFPFDLFTKPKQSRFDKVSLDCRPSDCQLVLVELTRVIGISSVQLSSFGTDCRHRALGLRIIATAQSTIDSSERSRRPCKRCRSRVPLIDTGLDHPNFRLLTCSKSQGSLFVEAPVCRNTFRTLSTVCKGKRELQFIVVLAMAFSLSL